MIYVTRGSAVYSPSLLNNRGTKLFPPGLPVERATNLPEGKYWLCPFRNMPRDWREYGRLYELKEIRPATDSEINQLPRRLIDRILLAADESHLWPVRNRFNATKRAIRRVRKCFPESRGLEYYLSIDAEISKIVNSEV
jgi:hypothetical protein